MRVEAQAPERIMAPVAGASSATIESLRARLLAERAASKEAREHAHKIALKVSELQSRLDAEIEQRKKAEVAMKEVLEVLRAKGVAVEKVILSVTSLSASSESEEALQLSSSKDGESEHSSGEEASEIRSISSHQDSVVKVPPMKALGCQSESGSQDEDMFSGKTQITVDDSSKRDASELEKVLVPEDVDSLGRNKSDEGKEGDSQNEELIKDEKNMLIDALELEKVLVPEDVQPSGRNKSDEGKGEAQQEELIKQEQSMLTDALELETVLVPEDVPSSGRDKSDEGKEGEAQSEQLIKHEQNMSSDALDKWPHTSQGDSIARQCPEMLDDSLQQQKQAASVNSFRPVSKCVEKAAGLYQKVKSNLKISMDLPFEQSSSFNKVVPLRSSIDDTEKAKGLLSEESATAATLIPSELGDCGINGGGTLHQVESKSLKELPQRGMAPPVRENIIGTGPNYVHPAVLMRGRYPYEQLSMSGDSLQHINYFQPVEAPVPCIKKPMCPAYTEEFSRYSLQVPMNEAILGLVDDKNGKLGNILMALNLAKQQINYEDYSTGYIEEPGESTTFTGKPYLGSYEGVPYQPPNHQWRIEPQNQAPIVHLPISPRSDREPSSFEPHDGIGRNISSTYAHMPGYNTYHQPKGELHLGNGITLYTD